jgi:hypothetical protein
MTRVLLFGSLGDVGGRDRVRVDPLAAEAALLGGVDGGAEAPPLQNDTTETASRELRENLERKPQISPLRSKSISKRGPQNCRSLHYATPDFRWNLVALMHFMRVSL